MAKKALKIAAVGCGLMVLAALVVAPSFIKYFRSSGGPCGHMSGDLHTIMAGARAYYVSQQWDERGKPLPSSFPANVIRTPDQLRCGDLRPVPIKTWEANGWGPLHFPGALSTPKAACTHEFWSSGTGTAVKYQARITCQWECGDVPRIVEVAGWLDEQGTVVTHGRLLNCRWRDVERKARKLLHAVTLGRVEYPDVVEFDWPPKKR